MSGYLSWGVIGHVERHCGGEYLMRWEPLVNKLTMPGRLLVFTRTLEVHDPPTRLLLCGGA